MKKLKVKVKKEFLDRYTGIKNKEGAVLEVTDARFREIQRSGDYVEIIPAEAAVKEEKKK